MAETQPVFASDLCYTPQELRRLYASLVCGEGVQTFTGLRVTESTPPDMTVDVSEGGGWVGQDQGGGDEGPYFVWNDAPVTLTVPDNVSGSTRTDKVWVRVCDSQYAPESSGWSLLYEENNPAGTPPADSCSYYLLATVSVPNNATEITGVPTDFGVTDGEVTDERDEVLLCAAAGFIERATGPASQTDYTAEAVAVTLVSEFRAGRRYRATGYVDGTQITASGVAVARIKLDAANFSPPAYCSPLSGMFNIPANTGQRGQGSANFTTTTGPHTLTLTISDTGGGAVRVSANQAYLMLEDLGPV